MKYIGLYGKCTESLVDILVGHHLSGHGQGKQTRQESIACWTWLTHGLTNLRKPIIKWRTRSPTSTGLNALLCALAEWCNLFICAGAYQQVGGENYATARQHVAFGQTKVCELKALQGRAIWCFLKGRQGDGPYFFAHFTDIVDEVDDSYTNDLICKA